MPTREELKALQELPLSRKILITQTRIMEWYMKFKGQVYVSFSGGKDSTVLLDIARKIYPDIEAVFVNTGLEYPEIQQFVKTFDNVTILRPKTRFDEVIRKYGYPFISKEVAKKIYYLRKGSEWAKKKVYSNSKFSCERYIPLANVDFLIGFQCCDINKKQPLHDYDKQNKKVPITAQTAEESLLRTQQWLKSGCNAFNNKLPISNPMSFWTEQDILLYIKENKLPIASVYGDIVYGEKQGEQYDNLLCDCGGKLCTTKCDRTGCIFCGFSAHLDKGESRFERLKRTHPRQYEYCMGGGSYQWEGKVQTSSGEWRTIDFIEEDGSPMSNNDIEKYVQLHYEDTDYEFQKLWKPTKDGLGMAHCIDELNKIYGKDFIRY